jgi:phosphoribosylformylglycinamidine cyclo-ligase
VPMDKINLGADVREGDVVVGLASTGIHSNGLSLARKALLEEGGLKLDGPLPGGAKGVTVGDALLEPTRIYVKPVLDVLRDPQVTVTALAHITGGGFLNMARIAAPCGYVLDDLPRVPPIFKAIAEAGKVGPAEMYAAYNMGVGFTITVRPGQEQRVLEKVRAHGLLASVIGKAVPSPVRRITLPAIGLESDDEADTFRPIG